MEHRQLEYFVAVVETGSFSKAAERCNVSQPSLSQQIMKLEQEIGNQLFDRLGRSIALTTIANILYPQAKAILLGLQQAKYSVTDGLTLETHRLMIGVIPTLAPYILRDAVLDFQQTYPGVELSIVEDVTEKLIEALLKAELDVCYVSLPIKNKQIVTEPLFTEPLYLAVANDNALTQQPVLTSSLLENVPFIMLHDEHCLSDQIEAFCYVQKINPHVLYQTAQLETALEFVRLDIGIALVPACTAAAYPDDDIAFLPIMGQTPERVIVSARHSGRATSQLGETFTTALTTAWHCTVNRSAFTGK